MPSTAPSVSASTMSPSTTDMGILATVPPVRDSTLRVLETTSSPSARQEALNIDTTIPSIDTHSSFVGNVTGGGGVIGTGDLGNGHNGGGEDHGGDVGGGGSDNVIVAVSAVVVVGATLALLSLAWRRKSRKDAQGLATKRGAQVSDND